MRIIPGKTTRHAPATRREVLTGLYHLHKRTSTVYFAEAFYRSEEADHAARH